jgi:hypothetical protein
MWLKVLVAALVLLGLPLVVSLLFELDATGGGFGGWLLLAIAMAALAVHQRRLLDALRRGLDAELGDLRERLTDERDAREGGRSLRCSGPEPTRPSLRGGSCRHPRTPPWQRR